MKHPFRTTLTTMSAWAGHHRKPPGTVRATEPQGHASRPQTLSPLGEITVVCNSPTGRNRESPRQSQTDDAETARYQHRAGKRLRYSPEGSASVGHAKETLDSARGAPTLHPGGARNRQPPGLTAYRQPRADGSVARHYNLKGASSCLSLDGCGSRTRQRKPTAPGADGTPTAPRVDGSGPDAATTRRERRF